MNYITELEIVKNFADLNNPNFAYIFGLFQSDGHISKETRNRGKFRLELNSRDREIIYKISKLLPVNYTISERKRYTNFSKENKTSSICLNIYSRAFREKLIELGIPSGKKSLIIAPPKIIYSEKDYWRGFIDGDGSLGITKRKEVFISLCTKSKFIKTEYCKFVYKIIGKEKDAWRNKRDNIYNINLYSLDAINMITYLYQDSFLFIPRKMEKAKEII